MLIKAPGGAFHVSSELRFQRLATDMEYVDGRVIMEARDIQAALERLSTEIIKSSRDPRRLALVGIHTGGVFLANRIAGIISGRLGTPVPLGSLDITLYRDDWTRLHTQPVLQGTNLPFRIDDLEVVLIDDVLFTGRTVRAALDALIDYGRPIRVQVAVLVDRDHRELPICSQFVGIALDTSPEEQVNVLLAEKDGVDKVVVEGPKE
ncbi:MAG: bifunctional pyr operon transcriptional regulator/uracil phosphoribosyltransferase PyrR [Syntrophobacteraceae bacterium]|nr:bifunctional pyr operon transcriptional regulator/uracil phosphoribosyltransferase PyrR [Syntrophobacteraceae bacterium]